MTPRIRCRVRLRPGASPGVKALRLVLRCRGPPRRVDLGDEKDREASPVFQRHRRLAAPNKISTSSVAGLRTETTTGM
jgi:hypothetical protein